MQVLESLALIAIQGLISKLSLYSILGLSIWGLGELLSLTLQVYSFAILITVILSWIAPNAYNPVLKLLHQVTEPILYPARNKIPPISGIDLSPMIVLILLQFA